MLVLGVDEDVGPLRIGRRGRTADDLSVYAEPGFVGLGCEERTADGARLGVGRDERVADRSFEYEAPCRTVTERCGGAASGSCGYVEPC